MGKTACAAMALASARAGYAGLSEFIIEEQPTAQRVDFIFRFSQTSRQSKPDPERARKRARGLALIILAGSIARYRAAPQCWDGEDERQLALSALAAEKDPAAMLGKIAEAAGNLVTEHWGQISPAVAA